jgi:hypothetical protein
MPRYQCHKQVWALKIKEIETTERTAEGKYGVHLAFEDEGYAPIAVSQEYFEKHSPEVGGYYVVYDDGYKSFSPAGPFEAGYARLSDVTGGPTVPDYLEPISGTKGRIDARSIHGDQELVRIHDHWFPASTVVLV